MSRGHDTPGLADGREPRGEVSYRSITDSLKIISTFGPLRAS
jgi:hypothetical protein